MFNMAKPSSAVEPDRRHELRYAVSQEISVHTVGQSERQLLGIATVRDVSSSGACVEMDVCVSTGTLVEFSDGDSRLLAVCRHTGLGNSRYVMGFQLLDYIRSAHKAPVPATW
jgi:hypothetical protein